MIGLTTQIRLRNEKKLIMYPLIISLSAASLWLYWIYFLTKTLLNSPGTLGISLSPWYKEQNIISALLIFIVLFTLLTVRKINKRRKEEK